MLRHAPGSRYTDSNWGCLMDSLRKALLVAVGAALFLPATPAAALAQSVPVILSESVSHITQNDATLEAHIDTEGVEYGAWYQFQLATNTSEYAEELACPPEHFVSLCIGVGVHSGALPIGFVQAGAPDQLVAHDLAVGGLTGVALTLRPNTTYHYRVIAAKKKGPPGDITSWEPPTVYGPDQTLTTSLETPTVTKVEPDHGPPGRRTTVGITGTGFSGATAVKFGASSAKSFTVNSTTSITAVSPKGKGTVDITVTTPGGTSATSAADQFTYSRKLGS